MAFVITIIVFVVKKSSNRRRRARREVVKIDDVNGEETIPSICTKPEQSELENNEPVENDDKTNILNDS